MIIVELEQTCGACPAQWEGRLEDGRHIYIRSRHGVLTVGVGSTIEAAVEAGWVGAPEGSELLLRTEDDAAGWLGQVDMLNILAAEGITVAEGVS